MGVSIEAKSIRVEVDTSDMSKQQFEIFLEDLRRGPKTVTMQELWATQNEGPYEELAPSPFAEVKPSIY